MKQGFLIFNPISGTRVKSPSVLQTVLRQFERRGIHMVPTPTEPDSVIGRVRELVRQSPDLVVAWGGDGTINEVANGMFGTEIPLGVIPGGTANLLAKELNIPSHPSDAIRVIARGEIKRISVGNANGRYFLLMVGIGFDSAVIANVDTGLKRKFGKFAFGLSAVSTARSYAFPKFIVKSPDREEECIFAVICNARAYAAYFILTPQADIFDDLFYVCLFKNPGFANMSRYVVEALRGRHHHMKSVQIFQTRDVEILGPTEVSVQADGELIGSLPVKFRIHPQSLPVFC